MRLAQGDQLLTHVSNTPQKAVQRAHGGRQLGARGVPDSSFFSKKHQMSQLFKFIFILKKKKNVAYAAASVAQGTMRSTKAARTAADTQAGQGETSKGVRVKVKAAPEGTSQVAVTVATRGQVSCTRPGAQVAWIENKRGREIHMQLYFVKT